MPRPDLVIFDCDGVLVDSEPITSAMLQEDLATRGLPLTFKQVEHHFVGGTMRGTGKLAAEMGAAIPDDWLAQIDVKMSHQLGLGTPLITGVEPVLDRLDAAGIPYCVASNGGLGKMQITLGQHPALQARLAGNIYSAREFGIPKPNPDMFLQAAKDRGIDPARTAVIEDSPTGCIAARRAGMQCFGFAEHDDGARLAAEGAQVFHAMHDLPAMLDI